MSERPWPQGGGAWLVVCPWAEPWPQEDCDGGEGPTAVRASGGKAREVESTEEAAS